MLKTHPDEPFYGMYSIEELEAVRDSTQRYINMIKQRAHRWNKDSRFIPMANVNEAKQESFEEIVKMLEFEVNQMDEILKRASI